MRVKVFFLEIIFNILEYYFMNYGEETFEKMLEEIFILELLEKK